MKGEKKRKMLHRARRLYARGLSLREVAAALGVAHATVHRWAEDEAEKGRDWQQARRDREHRRPDLVIERLENAFAQLLRYRNEKQKAGEGKKRLEDRLLKLLRVIELYKKTRNNTDARMTALEDFVAYCVENVPPEQMKPIRGAVNRYIEHLKRENS